MDRHRGFLCAAAFLALHTLASYYGYCNVPYDDWLEWLGGTRTATLLESHRNHYDRLMHFAYDLLLVLPVRQGAAKLLGIRGAAATWTAVEFLLATSALYEVGEWLLSRRPDTRTSIATPFQLVATPSRRSPWPPATRDIPRRRHRKPTCRRRRHGRLIYNTNHHVVT